MAAAVAEAQVTGCLPPNILCPAAAVTCILLSTPDLPIGAVHFCGVVVGFCWTAGTWVAKHAWHVDLQAAGVEVGPGVRLRCRANAH